MRGPRNGNIFCMEKLDPRLAAIIFLLYIRYLPGMLWERMRVLHIRDKKKENEDKMCIKKKKHWKNGDGAEIPDGGSSK